MTKQNVWNMRNNIATKAFEDQTGKHLFSLSVVQIALTIFAALFKLVCYDYKMATDPMLDPAEIMTQKLFD